MLIYSNNEGNKVLTSQKVNRYSKKLLKKGACQFRFGREYKPVRDTQTGFIHHPAGFPIEFRRIWFNGKQELNEDDPGNIGVIFESQKYIKPGATVEIQIPVRGEQEKFRGKVVLVRNKGRHYEIGLWLCHRIDASRARIVEQICHIESYFLKKKYQDGPYTVTRDRVAEEWISKYAGNVPSL